MSEVSLAPIKRIEGHGRVSLHLAEDGTVASARFDALEFRGFEAFLEGRMIWEMPLLTSRVCGICPVSHHVAAVKAVEDLLGATPPRPALLLRDLLHSAGFVHDHALHFFLLAGPDFLTGDGAGSRDLLGVIAARPDLARRAIALRKAGQRVVEVVGGQGHPVTAIPGGMSRGMSAAMRDELRELVFAALSDAEAAERVARESTERLLGEHPSFAAAPTAYMAQMGADGAFSVYDGEVRVLDAGGAERGFAASAFAEHVAERPLGHSYAKRPYLAGTDEDATYRVGPLARLNLARSMPGPLSEDMLSAFRGVAGAPAHAALASHWARMIELVAVLEHMAALLAEEDIVSPDVRVKVERAPGAGAAAVEAPRGTLFHRYEADATGRVTSAQLVVATTQNGAAIDAAVTEAVKGMPFDGALDEATFLRMELGIRAYDPCLSCATHEVGRMPLAVDVLASDGTLLASEGVR